MGTVSKKIWLYWEKSPLEGEMFELILLLSFHLCTFAVDL